MTLPAEAKSSALHLIESGVPVFIAKPAPEFPDGGHGGTGYLIPPGWLCLRDLVRPLARRASSERVAERSGRR